VRNKTLFLILSLTLILAACGGSDSSGAVTAVENYLNALANKDQATLLSNSCADWEETALIELDSFQLVEVTVDGMSCQASGADGDTTLVDCSGQFNMSYNGEPQSLDLSTYTFEVVNDSGNWLVCGER